MTELSLTSLVSALIPTANRGVAAGSLARHWGAEALLIFVIDEELSLYRPAPGFDQTLPGGAAWRDFLKRCATEEQFTTELPYPNRQTVLSATAFRLDGAIVLLLGGSTHLKHHQCLEESGIPLLCALLRTEAAAADARARAAAAGEASTRAKALASALDRARDEIQSQAKQLRDALEEASRLNSELSAFNQTLEARVAERSRQLEEEVDERRKIEAAFSQAQKMEAVGQLTGGIAHDFNNLLTVVIGGLDRIGRQLPELPKEPSVSRIERAKDMALEGARRAAILTHRLLAFSRRQPLEPKPIQLNKLVLGLSDMLQRTLGETIELETVLAAGLWLTDVDANQLESTVLNLAINARDAMAEGGGKLTIETSNAHIDEGYARKAEELIAPGQYVMLAVTDNGCGMNRETLERAFEPFFTTKELGLGTGLGLSQVYGFVRQSSGHIKLYSEAGEGTTVKIYLPRHIGAEDEEEHQVKPAELVMKGDGVTILVVEDEAALREHATECLRELGFHVFQADVGEKALDLLARFPQIDFLFTDVVLPGGMNGRQLAEEAKRRKPDLKVLFTTGYTSNAIVHHGRLDPGVQLISKPYTYADLAAKIEAILDRDGY